MHSSKNSNSVIVLDIETIPTQHDHMQTYLTDSVKAPANYKDADKIASYIAEAKAEVIDKSAFDGASNHIICIGWAINDAPAEAYHLNAVKDEADMIKAFYAMLQERVGDSYGHIFVGHNISGFDLRVLRQRSMILRVPTPGWIPFNGKPWDKNPYDTMVQWNPKEGTKLEKLARAFDIQGKTMDGSQVYKLWKESRFDEIAAYCKSDVELTRDVYRRMEFLS